MRHKKHLQCDVLKTKALAEDIWISLSILSVWMILIAFSVLSAAFPHWFEEIVAPGRETEVISIIEQADVFSHRGQYSKAAGLYLRALNMDPGNGPAMINHGITLMKMDRLDEGMKWLLKAEQVADLNRGTLLYHLGICHKKMGAIEKALVCYEEALDKEADNAMIYLEISRCYMDLKSYQDQLKNLDYALAAFSNPLEDYRRVLWSAEPLYRDSDPDNHKIIRQLLDSENFRRTDLGKYDLETFHRMKREDKFGAAIHFDMGLANAALLQYPEALHHFRKTLDYDPANQSAISNIEKIQNALNKR